MTKSRTQNQRFTTTRTKPVNGTRDPGETYVNFPDRQIGFIDSARNSVDLLAIRYFSTGANYVPGEMVVYNNTIYTANTTITAGAFSAGQWSGLNLSSLGGQPASYYLDFSNFSGSISAGQHSIQSDPTLHALATGSAAGFMSPAQYTKLDGLYVPSASQILASLITVDGTGSGLDADLLDGQSGAYYLNRANHTGEQAISTVTNLQTQLNLRLQDAPSSGLFYGRQSGAWVAGVSATDWNAYQTSVATQFTNVNASLTLNNNQIATLQSQMAQRPTDAPSNGQAYGRKNGSWTVLSEAIPKAPTVLFVTASQTVNVPANATHVIVEGVGGGGAGGGCSMADSSSCSAGGGGGAGAYGKSDPISLSGVSTIPITIGANGVGQVGTNGTGGGDTIVTVGGIVLTFGGGNGGSGLGSLTYPFLIEGGNGGVPAGVVAGGDNGQGGFTNGSNAVNGGAGASSQWGTGGGFRRFSGSATPVGAAGIAAVGYGAGGGGAAVKFTNVNRAGGNGSSGAVRLTWLYNMS